MNRLEQALMGVQVTRLKTPSGIPPHDGGYVRVDDGSDTWLCSAPIWDAVTKELETLSTANEGESEAFLDLVHRVRRASKTIASFCKEFKGSKTDCYQMVWTSLAYNLIDQRLADHMLERLGY